MWSWAARDHAINFGYTQKTGITELILNDELRGLTARGLALDPEFEGS